MFLTLLTVAACSEVSPKCPVANATKKAPSAGCFSTAEGQLLFVQDPEGRISLPGGGRKPGESAICAAFRETWEETGLQIEPGELMWVADTGFHLYRCERTATSGEIDIQHFFEIRAAFYLPLEQFDDYEWRYEDQREVLKAFMRLETRNTPE